MSTVTLIDGGRTGWPPGLLQDDSYPLFRWFASRLDAAHLIREQFGPFGPKQCVRCGQPGHHSHACRKPA